MKNRSTRVLAAALNTGDPPLPEALEFGGFECAQLRTRKRDATQPAFSEMHRASMEPAATPNNAFERTRVRRSRCAFPPLAAQLGR
jgi:hypothetical protein